MTKLTSLILSLTLVLTFAACGTSTVAPTEEPTYIPEETPVESVEPEVPDEPTPSARIEITEAEYTLSGTVNSQIYITAQSTELTLDNAEITSVAEVILAADSNQSIVLNLKGSNYITADTADAIVGAENFTITGDGALSVNSGDGKAITVTGTLIFDHEGECRFKSLENEAIEAEKIFFNNGNVVAIGGEDGVNASSDRAIELTTCEVNISGGHLTVYSKSDGIDSNGTITITGGEVAVFIYAPTDGDPLDADGAITITPGIFCFEPLTASEGKLKINSADGTYVWVGDLPGGDATSFFITSPEFQDGAEYIAYLGETELAAVTAGTEVQLPRQGRGMPDGAGRPEGGRRAGGGNVQIIPDPSTGGSMIITPGGVSEIPPGGAVPRQPGGGANSGAPGRRESE